MAGSSTREELTTGANFHSSRHWDMIFVGWVSVQRRLRDGRQFCGGRNTQLCSGHSACGFVFSISLSTAALLLSGGGSMFDRTGSHGSGVESRVPAMMQMVLLSCENNDDVHTVRVSAPLRTTPLRTSCEWPLTITTLTPVVVNICWWPGQTVNQCCTIFGAVPHLILTTFGAQWVHSGVDDACRCVLCPECS